jgi:hypothetical protein
MIETVKRETSERLKEAGWVGETLFWHVRWKVDLYGTKDSLCLRVLSIPATKVFTYIEVSSGLVLTTKDISVLLPSVSISDLQAEVSFDDLRAYFLHIHRDSIQLLQWTAEFYWSKFSSWLDSTYRSCEELAKVWIWKIRKEGK